MLGKLHLAVVEKDVEKFLVWMDDIPDAFDNFDIDSEMEDNFDIVHHHHNYLDKGAKVETLIFFLGMEEQFLEVENFEDVDFLCSHKQFFLVEAFLVQYVDEDEDEVEIGCHFVVLGKSLCHPL